MTEWLAPIAVLIGLALLVWLGVIPWLKRGPRGDPLIGLLWRLLRVFVRVVHRAHLHGLREFRNQFNSGPLIVVSNHTGAIDPLLIQAGCRFHIRWLMAMDMMVPSMNWLWRMERMIPVDRTGRDTTSAREAIRHVKAGGCVGIFPEGRIAWPPHQIRPFHPGVGFIVARTQAPVMLVWVTGTPNTNVTSKSMLTPSRAHVEFIEFIDFKGEQDAQKITQALRQRLAEVSGWPLNDEPMPAKIV